MEGSHPIPVVNFLGKMVESDKTSFEHFSHDSMRTQAVTITDRPSVAEFEKFHAARLAPVQTTPGLRELVITFALTLFMAPFSFVTFMVIPVMGQITVGLSVLLTILYIVSRRSWLVAVTAVSGTALFWALMFITIQSIKNNLELPLFFFTATGIPVSAMYCMFIGSRIWTVRGGIE